jgi:hypothetical protein
VQWLFFGIEWENKLVFISFDASLLLAFSRTVLMLGWQRLSFCCEFIFSDWLIIRGGLEGGFGDVWLWEYADIWVWEGLEKNGFNCIVF